MVETLYRASYPQRYTRQKPTVHQNKYTWLWALCCKNK